MERGEIKHKVLGCMYENNLSSAYADDIAEKLNLPVAKVAMAMHEIITDKNALDYTSKDKDGMIQIVLNNKSKMVYESGDYLETT